MGRPPLPEGEVRKAFNLRLSADERERVEAAAEQAGKPASQWAREVIVAAADLDAVALKPRRS